MISQQHSNTVIIYVVRQIYMFVDGFPNLFIGDVFDFFANFAG